MENRETASATELEQLFGSGVYPQRDRAFVRGQGARLFDDAGRSYIDCIAGIGAANLGHAHPAIAEAIHRQATRLTTTPGILPNDRRAELLQRLVAVAPGEARRAFLCNSGTEAVEGAIKFSRLVTGRAGIVAAKRGFHGRSLGALSATWDPKYREPFAPLVPGFTHVAYDDLAALEGEVDAGTAAVLLEVVQGEGGIRPGSREYLRGAQELCRERGALLILDEVQTGYGRTGKLFAAEHHDLQPDLLCIAKSMAGGVPMGGIVMGERLGELPRKVHGSTLGGNPLACAAALATLEVMEKDGLVARAAELGEHALKRLRAIASPKIREVRGLGLFLGLEMRTRVSGYLRRLQEMGILALTAGPTVIRLLPPLIIERSDLETVLDALDTVLTEEPPTSP